MKPNAAFFVPLLAKKHRTYTSFISQTFLNTHHLLSVINIQETYTSFKSQTFLNTHHLLSLLNIQDTKQNACNRTHGTKYHRYALLKCICHSKLLYQQIAVMCDDSKLAPPFKIISPYSRSRKYFHLIIFRSKTTDKSCVRKFWNCL